MEEIEHDPDLLFECYGRCWNVPGVKDGRIDGPIGLPGSLSLFEDFGSGGPGYLPCEDCYIRI